jgi:radical SAM superfamily enzyme YgiQ (UPF0313 family)
MGKRTVWGGIHPTINPEECAQYADVICRVEGEGFMLDLLRRLELGAGAWESRAEAIERRKRASRDL